ncbi:phosphoserine phosphatase (plasmid) [Thermobacillus composti KWC4]|jgi:phosphoserine phosphatase|uniref:Phosphoserine phosphatase n=1 Tax=Thermobacillus composti (strain DSM 18247 / JCM 13945 / KWC4) TaxID=717605 RepID=L0EKK1_THECK|nr:HAD family hydrolase [Thermobacillus composti]AGA60057.1 phosphoserine phosphatase [Thermobacillus composti KWC4]
MEKRIEQILSTGIEGAIFDVDNTLAKCNIVDFYLFIKKKELSPLLWWFYMFLFAFRVPILIFVDFISRDLFNRWFVNRKFRRFRYEELETYAEQFFEEFLSKRMIASTHDLIFQLKANGIPVVLLSTNFDLIVKQFGKYFDIPYTCLRIMRNDKGIMIDFSSLENFKENEVKKYSKRCIGVGDSKYDIPILNHVEYPFVVANKPRKWFRLLNKTPELLDTSLKRVGES